MRVTLALSTLAFTTLAWSAAAQTSPGERLGAAVTVPHADLAAERARLLAWMDAQSGTVPPQQAQAAVEQLYFLLGSAAQAHHRATGRLFPARDTLGMAELLDRGARMGLVGAELVARALRAPGPRATTAAALPGGTMRLAFDAPDYALTSSRGWALRFPFYVMIGTAQTSVPGNGVPTETVLLSTLFARNEGVPGHSQATILVNVAESTDSTAFGAFWLQALGMSAADRVADSPLAGAVSYRQLSTTPRMHKEVVVANRGRLTFVLGYIGLPGTYQANREEFLALLRTLTVSAPER